MKTLIEQGLFYASARQWNLQLHHGHAHGHEKQELKLLPNKAQNLQEACRTALPSET